MKPEMLSDDLLTAAEHASGSPVRLAYQAVTMNCDREGRLVWNPLRLAGAMPLDPAPCAVVAFCALEDIGLVATWTGTDGKCYGFVASFIEHQRINNREAASTLPQPSEEVLLATSKRKAAARRWATRYFANVTGPNPRAVTWTRIADLVEAELNGLGGARGTALVPVPAESEQVKVYSNKQLQQDAHEVFDEWRRLWGKTNRVVFDKRRAQKIKWALAHYSKAEVMNCLAGYKRSRFHNGDNDRSEVYDDICLHLRDAAHVEAGLKLFATSPDQVKAALSAQKAEQDARATHEQVERLAKLDEADRQRRSAQEVTP